MKAWNRRTLHPADTSRTARSLEAIPALPLFFALVVAQRGHVPLLHAAQPTTP